MIYRPYCEIMRSPTEEQRVNDYLSAKCNCVQLEHENDPSNWTLFFDGSSVWSVARPGSGASSSWFGSLDHIRSLIRKGYYKPENLNAYGRKLVMGVA